MGRQVGYFEEIRPASAIEIDTAMRHVCEILPRKDKCGLGMRSGSMRFSQDCVFMIYFSRREGVYSR